MSPVLNMSKFWKWQSSEYDRVLNMRAFHGVVNMLEYALIDFQNILGFKYARILNIPDF